MNDGLGPFPALTSTSTLKPIFTNWPSTSTISCTAFSAGPSSCQPSDPYAQQMYGAQPMPYATPYGVMPQPHPQGTAILVLGILGLLACGICGIVALIMGNKALKEIDANPAAYSNRQNVVIGRVLGIVAVALWGILLVVYAIIFIAALATSS